MGKNSNVIEIMKQGNLAPWLYVAPAVILMFIYIIYPGLNTFYLSFQDADAAQFASSVCIDGEPCWGVFENYRYALTTPIMLTALKNNFLWIVFMVGGTVGLGLLVAVLADRVRYEAVSKAIIFLPMAISFVGAGVIWKFVYAFGSSQVQIGLLNAIITGLGFEPVSFLTTPGINNYALIIVGVWIWTGFCMTILAAALKGVPAELLEAARIDGANEWIVFRSVTFPSILPTVIMVTTVMIINVLKIFDIIHVMTGGNFGTEVIANRMYSEMYVSQQSGRAGAIAVILVLLTVPFMIWNIKQFRDEEAAR